MADAHDPPRHLPDDGAPEPSTDFAARTLAALSADGEVRLSRALAAYRPPPVSPDFTQRTLVGLRADRAQRRGLRRWFAAAAAAAVVVATAAFALTRGAERAPAPTPLVAALLAEPRLTAALNALARPPRGDDDAFFTAVTVAAPDPGTLLREDRR